MAINLLSCARRKTFLEMLEPQTKLLLSCKEKEDEMWWQILLAISGTRQTETFKIASALVKKILL